MSLLLSVIPAKAGIQWCGAHLGALDSRFRGNDDSFEIAQ